LLPPATSEVRDHVMIEQWFKIHVANCCHERINHGIQTFKKWCLITHKTS
jgi:hypothetical protein